MPILVTERARQDLLSIYSYLAERNIDAAEALLRRFDSNFENLSRFPFLGRDRPNLGTGVRALIVGTHIVFYVAEQRDVFIVRVIDGRMDVDEEFKR